MPGRRSFLIGCGCIVVAPAFGEIGLPLAIDNLPSADTSAQVGMDLVLRIEGWDGLSNSQNPTDDCPWIRINSSWRAAWR
jgi:hypothetical protein